jgi:predicted component of type VI protein secretion system
MGHLSCYHCIIFEPRIDPSSPEVEIALSGPLYAQHNIVRLLIRGHLGSQPVPLELLLETDVDVETGLCASEGHEDVTSLSCCRATINEE